MTNFWADLKKGFSVLAPMEDVTDTVFRHIVLECGRPDVFFTEFTSTDGLMSKGRKSVIRRLQYDQDQRPIVAQIWGNKPENYLKSAQLLVELGFDGIDINMGCPVRKVVKHGFCSGLILNKNLAREIVLATIEGAGEIPVSVKTRMGFNKIETESWTEYLLNMGIKALTIHGRLAKDLSKFPANWEEISKAVAVRDSIFKDNKDKPLIIGNGDADSLEDIKNKVETYKVDGVMVGRGIFKDPFLFNPTKSIEDLSVKERMELLLNHSRLFVKTWSSTRNFAVLKKFYKIYINNFEGASEMRAKLMECETLADVETTAKLLVPEIS
jgi:nifR3 family TIM-barrel protein